MFETVLIANRGEIACRIIRTLRSLGIRSVAVYSDADANARHVREADVAVRLGPARAAESYLSIERIIAAATVQGAQAIHPGYGFLSENVEFARACEAAGIVFIGPGVEALDVMGDKIRAKHQVEARGVPTVPGIAEAGLDDEALAAAALRVGFPVLIKPSAGGGGKGMHLVEREDELRPALATARREAASSSGDDTLFIERFVTTPRHIEVQVLADGHGTTVHLGERECSLQRRHQKVIEEAPSALLDETTRRRIGEAAVETARSVGYLGAGTVEFIVSADAPDEFFFMEMNTRLQVEHPVTELVTGVDLVEWQLRIAAGEALDFAQEDVRLTGHAVEARVYAEDPQRGFLPTGGRVRELAEPTGEGIRVDSALLPGSTVSSDYDPMLAKVIAWAPDRTGAIERLDSALARFATLGVGTNVEFLRLLLADSDVRAGRLDTELIERRLAGLRFREADDEVLAVAALVLRADEAADAGDGPWSRRDGWRLGDAAAARYPLSVAGRSVVVGVRGDASDAVVSVDDGEPVRAALASVGGPRVALRRDGVIAEYLVARERDRIHVGRDGVAWTLTETSAARSGAGAGAADPELRSPMPGAVTVVPVADGDRVDEGQAVVVIEAMKMEHVLRAPHAGTIALRVAVGDQVRGEQVVAVVSTAAEAEEDA